jgi:hypothetical protein
MYHWRPRPLINEIESDEHDVDCGAGLARERAVRVDRGARRWEVGGNKSDRKSGD